MGVKKSMNFAPSILVCSSSIEMWISFEWMKSIFFVPLSDYSMLLVDVTLNNNFGYLPKWVNINGNCDNNGATH